MLSGFINTFVNKLKQLQEGVACLRWGLSVRSLPQSAPWLVSVCAAFWLFGRCPPLLRNASSPGRYSEWWRHLSAQLQHWKENTFTLYTASRSTSPIWRLNSQQLRRRAQPITCSERRWVRPDRTAPWFCALVRWSRWSLPRTWARLARASRWTGTGAPFSTGHPAEVGGLAETLSHYAEFKNRNLPFYFIYYFISSHERFAENRRLSLFPKDYLQSFWPYRLRREALPGNILIFFLLIITVIWPWIS